MRKRNRRRRIRNITFPALPTAFTLANGVCGLAAITVVTSNVATHSQIDLAFYAGVLIFLGMVFDVLDGHVARMTHQTSQFGKELDSLCDVITFGIAPVFIMLTYDNVFQKRFLWGIGVLYAVSAILRLARFNVQKDEHKATTHFQGLPTPMAAGAIASFSIAMPSLLELSEVILPTPATRMGKELILVSHVVLPLMTAVLAWLMVSRVRYPHLVNELSRRRSFPQLVEIVFAMVVVITLKEFALPILFGYFVFAPLIKHLRVTATARFGRSEPLPHERAEASHQPGEA